ncbi:MAG: nucleoside triphosphate pyrophosphohydrolase [Bacteroidales bacterium]|nr:nucleoside triphosphate pyrophosphohydrolase [Bacteroidales bacterium]
MDDKIKAFRELLDIMDELRGKCPWDKNQTFESLRHLTIEETYELSEAILQKNTDEIKKELGDLMLHLVFYAKIGSETGAFDIGDVLRNINEKLIRRHPHIYGGVVAEDARAVRDNWEKIKLGEGKKSVLEGVPKSLPTLVKAYRIQEKASGVGFDWQNASQVWKKVLEELDELNTEVNAGKNTDRIEAEYGDLLFSLVNYSRFIGVNPEDALEKSNRKFIRRFQKLEDKAEGLGKSLHLMPLNEMDGLWNEIKEEENPSDE